MEDSKKYAARIKQLFRSLKRKGPKPEELVYSEPTEALIYGIVSERITQDEAKATIGKFKEHFVDSNDLRISPAQEIAELFSENNENARTTAMTIANVLQAVFDKYNTISLAELRRIGKRPARDILEQLCTSRFAIDYCVLTSLGGHTIPLTEKMIAYLKAEELVNPGAVLDDIEGFLARQISAKDAYDFYYLLRRQSEKGGDKAKGKQKVKGKTAGTQ